MPITSYIGETKDLTIFTVTGVLSFDEVMPVVKAFYDDVPTKHVMWDLLKTTEVQLTSKQVEAIASFSPRYEGKRESGKTAFVAQEDVLFGLSRMFEIQSTVKNAPHSTMVFRSTDEAYQWIDEP